MIVGGLKSSTSRRRYRKDNRVIQIIHTKHRNPCVGQSSPSRSLGLITGSTSQILGRTHSSSIP
jgi:hypothetical protein